MHEVPKLGRYYGDALWFRRGLMPIIIADEYGVLDNIEEPQNRMRLLQLFRPLVHSGSNSTAY